MDRITPMPFWFLRHGETDWNRQNLSQGDIDIPLNETGRVQAERAAELLRGHEIRSIVSSNLSRAMDTAAAVATLKGLTFTTDPGLREVKFGEQEGQPMGDWYDDWIAGSYTPEGAETFAGLRSRVVSAINRALEEPAPVLIVGHGALFRAVRSAMGLVPNIRTPNAVPFYCVPPAGGEGVWELRPAEAAAA